MDFNLTEERQMLQDSLRRFLGDKYNTENRNSFIASEQGFSPDVWHGLAELGMIGALFDAADGGFGGAGFDLAVLFEELGRAGAVDPLLETGVLAGGLLAALGNGGQKALLEEVIAGSLQLALAHGEPAARYDLNFVETRAQETSDGWVLNGHKAVVLNGGAADKLIVSARSSGTAGEDDGISLFLVDAERAGIERRSYGTLTGGHSADIRFNDCKLPADALLGRAGGALPALETAHARAILAICAEALGAMETAKDLTIEYLKTRQQFGRPIGKFQVLQHRMADVLIEIEQARSAVINAAGHLEDGDRDLHISAAKNLIGRVGRQVAEEAIQLHGGIGMTQEYDLGHFAKRIVLIDHLFGDTDHHLERFIALCAA